MFYTSRLKGRSSKGRGRTAHHHIERRKIDVLARRDVQVRRWFNQRRRRYTSFFLSDQPFDNVGRVIFTRAQEEVFVFPEQRGREAMGPCFVVVCGALDVSCF